MIRLAHPKLSTVFEFRENLVNSLVVEAPTFFRELLTELMSQAETEIGTFVLSEEYTPLKFIKHAEVIHHLIPFDPNRKSLLTKLYSNLEQKGKDGTNYRQTQTLLAQIEQYLLELSLELPGDIILEKVSLIGLIRSVGVRIADDPENPLGQLLDYMELVRELEGEKVFFLINLRCYYSFEELQRFTREALTRKMRLLLIDAIDGPRLPNEYRWLVDADLCEI